MADEYANKLEVLKFICDIGGDVEYNKEEKQSEHMVKNWLETQDCSRFAFLKDKDENVTGVQIGLGKRMCLHYYNTGSHHTTKGCCSKWHICKRFLEGDCSGGCGRSHDFRDDHNRENTKRLGSRIFRMNSSEGLLVTACHKFASGIWKANARAMNVRIFTSVLVWSNRHRVVVVCLTALLIVMSTVRRFWKDTG